MRNCNQVRVEYNPYQQKIQYQYRRAGTSDWQSIEDESGLENGSKYKNAALQSVLSDVIKIINHDFNIDGRLEVVFCGTETDFNDFNDAALQCSPPLKVVRDQTTEYLPAPKVVWQIDQIFESLKDDFAQQGSRDIQTTLEKYSDTTSSVIPICVMGLYSSGKSTFINALVGAEILPAAAKSTTAKVFKISHGDRAEVRFECQKKKIWITFENNAVETSLFFDCPPELSELHDRIRSISGNVVSELVWNVIKTINNDESGAIEWVEITFPFHNSLLVESKVPFEIYDTPGPNVADHKDHAEILGKAINGQTNGLPVFITDLVSLQSKGTTELEDYIRDTGKMFDLNNTLIIVNKADEKSVNDIETAKSSNLGITGRHRTFFISAAIALGCKKERLSWNDESGEMAYENVARFCDDGQSKFFRSLPQYNILPNSRYDFILGTLKEAKRVAENSNGKEDAKRELIAHNSGIRGVESEIAYFAERFAPYNKCRMAITYLSEAIGQTREKIKDKMEEQESLEKSLECKRAERYDDITTKMNDKSVTFKKDASKEATKYLQQHDSRQTIEKKAIGNIRNAYSLYKKDKDKTYLKEAVRTNFEGAKKDYADSIKKNLETFWNERETAFRDQIIGVITNAQSISEKEKELLESVIREKPPVETPKIPVRVEGFKPGNIFRRIFRLGEKVDIEECVESFRKQLNKVCADHSNDARGKYEEKAEKWINELLKVIEKNLDDFNEDLRTISNQIKDARGEILRLQEQASKLGDASESIQRLMSVQTRGENCT